MAVTIKEVAMLAGTSAAAVSATLNGTRSSNIRVGSQTRERIYAAAAQLGYISNPVARSLATGRSRVLGLMLPYVEAFTDHNPFCAQATNGVLGEMVRCHYNLMLYTGTTVTNGAKAAMMVDSRVDGVVLVMPAPDSAIFLKCESRHIPYVSILREPMKGALTVNSDDLEGGRLATDHLVSLGHQRIAHLMGQDDVITSLARLEGYRKALSAKSISLDDSLIMKAGFDWRGGYAATKHLMERPLHKRPTAIFAANDLCAEGALRALRELGASIPEDVAIVGYDDTWFATMTQPALTSVRMPIEEMGALAVQMLVDRVEGRDVPDLHPVLPVSLTVRASCGAQKDPQSQTTSIPIINEDINHATQ